MNTQIITSNIVYILCTLTALACAWLLLRGYLRTKVRLLWWAGLSFVLFTLNNAMVFVDVVSVPQFDLSLWRTVPALVGVSLLIYGLIWEGSQND